MTEARNKSAAPGDWRAARLNQLRDLIKRAAPDAVEEQKWKKPSNPSGVPTWSDHGMICAGETYKGKVKLTFAQGARLDDPHGLFNTSLDGKARRAIDLKQSDSLDEQAFLQLIRAAVNMNRGDAKG